MITQLKVLNTLADNAADFYVDLDGNLNVTGLPKANEVVARTNIQTSVAAVAGVSTTTFVAQNSYTYQFQVQGYTSSGDLVVLPFAYTSPSSGTTATVVATAVAAIITASQIGAQFASVAGGATLVLTGTTTYPLVKLINTYSDSNISPVQTTAGVQALGLGSVLLQSYDITQFADSANITPSANYTQILVQTNPAISRDGDVNSATGINQYLVLVNEAATSSGSDNAVVNRALILNSSYGTAYLLQAGQRAVPPTTAATTTAAITVTSGLVTLASGAVTYASLGAQSGDYLVINSGTTFSAIVSTKITGVTTNVLAYGTNIVAQSAEAFKYIAVRTIPRKG
jgi:hypothetical protein